MRFRFKWFIKAFMLLGEWKCGCQLKSRARRRTLLQLIMQTYTFYLKEEKEKGKKLLKSLFYCIFAEDKLHLGKAIKQACFFAETSLRRHLLKTSLRNTRHLT